MTSRQIIFFTFINLGSVGLGLVFWPALIFAINKPSISSSLLSILIAASWLTSLSLLPLLNDRFWLGPGSAFVNSLTILGLGLSLYTLSATAIVFASLLWLNYSINQNQKIILHPSLNHLLAPLTTAISLLALTLGLLYFPVALEKSRTFRLQLPDQIFNGLLQSLVGGQGSLDSTNIANQNFESQIPFLRSRLNNQGITDPSEVEKQISKARTEFQSQLQENLNKQILDPAPIKKLVESQLNNLVHDYRVYLPFILSVSVYFALNLFSLPVYFLTLLLSQICLGLLRAVRFVVVTKESVEVERLKVA